MKGYIKPVSANESDIVFKNSKIRFLLERPENAYRIHSRTLRSFEKFRSSVSDMSNLHGYPYVSSISILNDQTRFFFFSLTDSHFVSKFHCRK